MSMCNGRYKNSLELKAPQTCHPGLSNMSSRTLKHVIPDSQTCHPGLSNMSSRTLKHVIPDSQTCHPGLSNMSSRTLKHVIPDSQTCHPGLDPGSPNKALQSCHFQNDKNYLSRFNQRFMTKHRCRI